MMNSKNGMQELFAERIGGKTFGEDSIVYKFEKIKRVKKEAMIGAPQLKMIDMGVGEPDWMADPKVIEILAKEAKKSENRGYADNGSDEFKQAASTYMEKVFGVGGLNWETEINHCMGSKPALAQLPAAFINPGDVTLMTVPGYPIIGTHTEWFGGEVYSLPLVKENHFLPDLTSLPENVKQRAKILYINYPNNPTGANATKEFYEEVVAFAKENNLIVVSDEAYAALTFKEVKPISFLSVEGAKEVGISIHSLSKAYNMTGWRLGFVAGNEKIIKAWKAVKDNHDSGQFLAIQKAGIYCLEHPEITRYTADKYERRHKLLVEALCEIGFEAEEPKGSFYLYVKSPKGVINGPKFESAEDFSHYLIKEKMIATVPWDDAGRFIRFSVTFKAETVSEEMNIIHEIKKRLMSVSFEW